MGRLEDSLRAGLLRIREFPIEITIFNSVEIRRIAMSWLLAVRAGIVGTVVTKTQLRPTTMGGGGLPFADSRPPSFACRLPSLVPRRK